jgi:hypothetical protein|tara:strand:+ start:44 stop:292 length:249 start_codon:yes stop_codon:yes gene_type:complete
MNVSLHHIGLITALFIVVAGVWYYLWYLLTESKRAEEAKEFDDLIEELHQLRAKAKQPDLFKAVDFADKLEHGGVSDLPDRG